MSDDIDPPKNPSGGFIALPKRLPFSLIVPLAVVVFGFGGWATALQFGVNEAKAETHDVAQDVDAMRQSVRRMERYMCLDCVTTKKLVDCSDICGMRRLEAP